MRSRYLCKKDREEQRAKEAAKQDGPLEAGTGAVAPIQPSSPGIAADRAAELRGEMKRWNCF